MRLSFNIKSLSVDIIETDTECVYIKDKINKPWSRFIKRSFDLVFSLLFLIFVAPWLFLIVSIAIMLETKGSPFFVQKRTGRDRNTFYCIKFRTMCRNKDANRLQVQIDDSRITKVGSFLRESHIDELPQIFNVIFGQMSIVGPRPHMLRHNGEN